MERFLEIIRQEGFSPRIVLPESQVGFFSFFFNSEGVIGPLFMIHRKKNRFALWDTSGQR
jgi:hypothetical protein